MLVAAIVSASVSLSLSLGGVAKLGLTKTKWVAYLISHWIVQVPVSWTHSGATAQKWDAGGIVAPAHRPLYHLPVFCTCAASDVMLAVPLWQASCKLGLLQVLRSPIASGTLGWR